MTEAWQYGSRAQAAGMASRIDWSGRCPVTALTAGPAAHFFGYYYHSQWNPGCTRLVAHAAPSVARMPKPGEAATICLREDDQWRELGKTRAWNWQTGSHLQWLDDQRLIYNDRRDGQLCAVIKNCDSEAERLLPRAVCGAHGVAGIAVSLDFERLAAARPVLGVASEQPVDLRQIPADDGVWSLSLTGTADPQLLLSLADCVACADGPDYDMADRVPAYKGRPGFEQPTTGHRLGGLLLSPSGRYALISHHWPRRQPLELPHFQRHVWDRKIVYDRQTGTTTLLGPDGFYSHNVWLDDDRVLMWGHVAVDGEGEAQAGLWLMHRDGQQAPERILPELVNEDPHASLSPDKRLLLGDGYPSNGKRPLWICDLQTGTRYDLGGFASPAPFDRGPFRCDLHPRWRPDGQMISFDSVHAGSRQVYGLDLRPLLDLLY